MKNLFLAKNSLNELVYTDGDSYAIFPLAKTFNDFLKLDQKTVYSFIENVKAGDLTEKMANLNNLSPLIEDQIIMATGVTFSWSDEKLNETPDSDVYKKIFLSKRPLIFMKGNRKTLSSAYGEAINLREDCEVNIPEAELVAYFNVKGEVMGFCLGNDLTAYSFEKENPLYQLQAKFYKGSGSFLPLMLLTSSLPSTDLNLKVFREEELVVETNYSMKSFCKDLTSVLKTVLELGFFDHGGGLFLGCGMSYPKENKLERGDRVMVSSDLFPLKLVNTCEILERIH